MKIYTLLAMLMALLCGCLSHTEPPRTLAIWDFDGTIIKGDCSEGLHRDGVTIYDGIVKRAILAGFSRQYKGEEGVQEFFRKYYDTIAQGNSRQAYKMVGQIFAGAREDELQKFCQEQFAELSGYYFVDSIDAWNRLKAKGVENHVISASCEIFVKGAAASLGIPEEWIHGIQIRVVDGILTDEILEPLPFGEGKVSVMRSIEKQRQGKAMYGFGNSNSTDGPFLREIIQQGGTATFLNPKETPAQIPQGLLFVNWDKILKDAK